MTNKFKSLLWLRWQFLLSNKLFLILVVSPPLYILLISSMGILQQHQPLLKLV